MHFRESQILATLKTTGSAVVKLGLQERLFAMSRADSRCRLLFR